MIIVDSNNSLLQDSKLNRHYLILLRMTLYPHFPGEKEKSEGNKVQDPIFKKLQNWNSTSIRHPRTIPNVYTTGQAFH